MLPAAAPSGARAIWLNASRQPSSRPPMRGPICTARSFSRWSASRAGFMFEQQARAGILGELLEPGGEVHRVANRGVLLAPRRADRAGDRLADMDADADP